MKVAVVGAGVAGLSTAWHLLEQSQASLSLDIFDPLPIGEGTSGLASGLLHPYAGLRSQLHWKGEEMMKEAHRLLSAASLYANTTLVTSTGVLRIPLSSAQALAFKENAKKYSDAVWLQKKDIERVMAGIVIPEEGALFLQNGVTVDVKNYLRGLIQAITRLGGQWRQQAITDPAIFADYDRVVIAMGADISVFSILASLPFSKIKGQSIELSWPKELPPLQASIVADGHIVMRPDQRSCLIGATFEREYLSPAPDLAFAQKELLSKAIRIIPALETSTILGCYSGIRACPIGHRPLVGRLNERFWFFTGLCAKGLLYHGYLGRELATALLEENEHLLPKEVYFKVPLPS